MLLILLAAVAFFLRGSHDERVAIESRDFKQPYASARCLLHGCDPYSEADTHAEFLRAGGGDEDKVVFVPHSAIYPPFSFALLTPLAALPWKAAHTIWEWTIGLSFSIAALCVADLSLRFRRSLLTILLLTAFVVSSTILLMEGQISGPVIALLVVAFWALLREKPLVIPIVALSLALALKPHDSILLASYLLFAGPRWRRALAGVALLTSLIVCAGTVWCSHQSASAHWYAELRANLVGNSAPGDANDPSPGRVEAVELADLQPLFATVTSNTAKAEELGLLVSSALALLWLFAVLHSKPSFSRDVLALAAMACITLLPVYHRQYDTRLLLFLFPAAACLVSWRGRTWGAASLLLLAGGVVSTSFTTLSLLLRHPHLIERADAVRTLLVYRPLPLTDLTLALFFLAALLAYAREHPAWHSGMSLSQSHAR